MGSLKTIRERRQLILVHIPRDFIQAEFFFHKCKILGYPNERKSFQRDLILLEKQGKLERKVCIGGKDGTTSYVRC